MEATTPAARSVAFVRHGVVFIATSLVAGLCFWFSWMTRSHFNGLRLILTSRLFLKSSRKCNLYEQLQSGVRPQQRNSIIKNDLWPADDSWHLFPHYRGSSRSERGLDAISRTILQKRLASITPPPSLFHHISLRYHTKFMFCFCWGAPGFRSGASFIHCLHASTRSRFRNTVLAFTVTRMTLRCIFFTLPRISLCDCLMEVIAWFSSHIYPK